eukprot:4022473-Amphidinium_carterae.1
MFYFLGRDTFPVHQAGCGLNCSISWAPLLQTEAVMSRETPYNKDVPGINGSPFLVVIPLCCVAAHPKLSCHGFGSVAAHPKSSLHNFGIDVNPSQAVS